MITPKDRKSEYSAMMKNHKTGSMKCDRTFKAELEAKLRQEHKGNSLCRGSATKIDYEVRIKSARTNEVQTHEYQKVVLTMRMTASARWFWFCAVRSRGCQCDTEMLTGQLYCRDGNAA